MDWVDKIARAIYGSDTIREALICVAKKNGKTSHGGLLFLAAFLAERTPRQSFTIVAPTVSISSYAFDQIVGAINADDTLKAICHVRRHTKEVEHRTTGCILQVKAFSKEVLTGLKGSVLLDEAWLIGDKASGEMMRAQIKGALMASEGSKCISISTTSDSIPRGSWATMIKYARAVRDGDIQDDSFLPVIYEPWTGADPWEDESIWPLILPSFPHIAPAEFYRSIIKEAEAAGPSAVARDKAQFFNVEPTSALASGEGWSLAEMYDRTAEPLTLNELIARSDAISFGVDLGGLDDICAMAAVGVDNAGTWLIWFHCLATETVWSRNISISSILDNAINSRDLTKVRIGEDIGFIVDVALQLKQTNRLKAVGIDPAGAAQLVDALEATEEFYAPQDDKPQPWAGAVEIMGVGQSAMRLMPAIRTLERKAATGDLVFRKSDLLAWMLGNVRLVQRGAAVGIDRENKLAKIDAIAAILDAASVELVVQAPQPFDVTNMIG